jgi:hypothetical protein
MVWLRAPSYPALTSGTSKFGRTAKPWAVPMHYRDSIEQDVPSSPKETHLYIPWTHSQHDQVSPPALWICPRRSWHLYLWSQDLLRCVIKDVVQFEKESSNVFTFGQRPRGRDLRRHEGEIMRRTNQSRWVYLDGSYLIRSQITRMCDHNCVHKVGRTQTTRDSTAITVSKQNALAGLWIVHG